ncbi:MAG: glycosyltransferase [Erysipelotrichales bacterium]|nr:glycosyltransferase [Erysipelotrichales bacterium]
MKVCLYFENEKSISKSGIGRAMKHQMAALTAAGIEYTTDPNDTFDILHVNTYGPNSLASVAKAHADGKKVIYHAHSTEEDFRNSFVLSNQLAPLVKQHLINAYSMSDYIITPTPYSKKLLESYGIDKEIVAISNGIELKRFVHDEEKIKAFRKYFHLADDQKVVLSVGLFFERKGLLDFIEVAKHFPDVKFIWFGQTPMYSIPKKMREAVEENHPTNVIFPGYVKGPIIEGAFTNADVFFFPSLEETEGIVVLEALAGRREVLLRDIPVYDPWMIDGVNCYKGKSNEEFIEILGKMLNKELPSTAIMGRKVAEERSIESVGQQLKEVYTKVLRG